MSKLATPLLFLIRIFFVCHGHVQKESRAAFVQQEQKTVARPDQKLCQVLKKSLTLIANPKKLGLFQFIQEHETFGKGWLRCLLAGIRPSNSNSLPKWLTEEEKQKVGQFAFLLASTPNHIEVLHYAFGCGDEMIQMAKSSYCESFIDNIFSLLGKKVVSSCWTMMIFNRKRKSETLQLPAANRRQHRLLRQQKSTSRQP
jgi:hypothetical protein